MYESLIIIKRPDNKKIKEFLEGEDKELNNKRARIEIEEGEFLKVKIYARDAVSLRAMSNAVLKALSVWEKMEAIK